jgi:hypothetical protein
VHISGYLGHSHVIKRTESVRKEKCVTDEWQFLEGYNVGGTIRKSKSVIEEEWKTSKTRRFLKLQRARYL